MHVGIHVANSVDPGQTVLIPSGSELKEQFDVVLFCAKAFLSANQFKSIEQFMYIQDVNIKHVSFSCYS